MPINSGGACSPMTFVMAPPQSPPCETNCEYPIRVPRDRWNHEMKSVRRARAVRRGVGQRTDDLQLLDNRAGPAVRDDERQRFLMLRTNVNEVNVESIDLGDEMRQGV